MAKRKTAKGEDYGDFFENLAALAEEKGIDSGILAEKIKYAIETSLKSNLHINEDIKYETEKKKLKSKPDADGNEEESAPAGENEEDAAVEEGEEEKYVCVDFDIKNRVFDVSIMKEVIEEIDSLYEPEKEIVLEEARKIDPRLEVGDRVRCPIDTRTFKRIAAKHAKDLIHQGFANAERQRLSEIWGQYENEAVSATVTRIEPKTGHATVEINKNEVMLPRNEQIPGETLEVGQVVKVFISGVSKEYKESDKNQYLKVSRNDRGLIKRLFELECPEIFDGTVEIKAVSRAPGSRSKVAVISHDPNVDAVGACIGPQKSRINAVTKEIKGEKVDVVLYSDIPEEFIKQALKPADAVKVVVTNPNLDKRACKVVVPDNQLSLAIGNKGQNAWLAAKLTGYKIDIKSESTVTPEDFIVAPLEVKPEPETQENAVTEQSADGNAE
ncbi:MAG: transcription termination factor NusA [Lachnospiraceae bacterium]|nr:transcription termination factor NusA [Ruminococcus sp.]MCM1275323.1 transcription termination factor NusA [Lachnospiraceae bacterium]